jgi:hypothetical protein
MVIRLLKKDVRGNGVRHTVWAAIQHSYDFAKECEHARAKAALPPAIDWASLLLRCER